MLHCSPRAMFIHSKYNTVINKAIERRRYVTVHCLLLSLIPFLTKLIDGRNIMLHSYERLLLL